MAEKFTISSILSNFFDYPDSINTAQENAEILKKVLKRTKCINNEEQKVVNEVLEALEFYKEDIEHIN